MNAILHACDRAEAVYFGGFCIRSRSRVFRATSLRCIRDQETFADAYQGKLG
jgi:hypothetical protein